MPPTDDALYDELQRRSFKFFRKHVPKRTGLALDSTQPGSPSSIAGVGFGLTCYAIAVERGFMKRSIALDRCLAAVRFFDEADQSGAVDGTGYKGFFYHFLDPRSGKRAWDSELSTIDTALLVAGMLFAAAFFDGTSAKERELRERVRAIYARVDWRWAQDGGDAIVLKWTPERGFSKRRWVGFSEALILYVLALGAPELSVDEKAYRAWTSTFAMKRIYGRDVLYAGPLFIHQFSQLWLDLQGVPDAFMRKHRSDYFENTRLSTLIHHEYAVRNPRGFRNYDASWWAQTASDGPGEQVLKIAGRRRHFHGYAARGAPFGPDDGTIAPWCAVASLPFAPEVVLPTMRALQSNVGHSGGFCFHASFNPTFPESDRPAGWISPWHFALNQAPIMIMIENHRTKMPWLLARTIAPIRTGLERAGFEGGWLR